MPKRIIIAVQSDIVRKGIATIARQADGCIVLERENISDTLNCDFTQNTAIIFDANQTETFQTLLSPVLSPKVIAIVYIPENYTKEKPSWANLAISAGHTESAILAMLNSLFIDDTKSKQKKLHPEGLSAREKDVLRLVATGLSNKEIADKLFISIHTVVTHRKNITDKLGIKSISGLTVYAIINGIIDSDSINVSELV